jgi:hypothetical protein
MPSPYRREELIADTATLVYLLSGHNVQRLVGHRSHEIELISLLPVTSCLVDSATIYIKVVKFRNTICPPPLQLSLHRRAALSRNSNGTRYVYSRKNTKSSLYCEVSMVLGHSLYYSTSAGILSRLKPRLTQVNLG